MTGAELAAAGFPVSSAGHALLTRYAALLLEENRRLNLTAARDEAELWRAHVCDALALVPRLAAGACEGENAAGDAAEPGEIRLHLLDLGSGGGLPGLPVACVCPQIGVTLLDATRKKVTALERIIDALGLPNARTVCGRAETLAHDSAHREQYQALTARAVGELRLLLEYASGFVAVGGTCWFYKSAAGAAREIPAATSAARACRLELAESVDYRLPGDTRPRVLVGYRKVGPLRANLPRSAAQAKHHPL